MRTRITPASEVFADRQQNAVQDGVRQTARAINRQPFATSVVLGPHTFAGGDSKTWYHGLGRTPSRWQIEDLTGDIAAIYRTAWDDQTITIACQATFTPTVTIRVGVD